MSAPSLLAVAPGSASTYAFVPNLPQEVKFKDIPVSFDAYLLTYWHYASIDALVNIDQGYGPSERIGRSIRVVGIVFRADCKQNYFQAPYRTAKSYTMDFLWDNRTSGLVPPLEEIYDEYRPEIYVEQPQTVALPNPLYESRFKFIKRIQREPKHLCTTVDFSLPCSKLITYEGALPSSELYITFGLHNDDTIFGNTIIKGLLRVLYVDA